MPKAAGLNAIEKGTGINWTDWLKFLEDINAKDLPHKEIAKLVHQKLEDSLDNPGWWAQSVTVAYEQHIGRRKPGQKNDGTYETSVTKTISANMDVAFQKWLDMYGNQTEFAGVAATKLPSITSTARRHHWGINLVDNSRVNVDADSYTAHKTRLAITHIRLDTQTSADEWRQYWKDILETL